LTAPFHRFDGVVHEIDDDGGLFRVDPTSASLARTASMCTSVKMHV
jgi:hypothetical protein